MCTKCGLSSVGTVESGGKASRIGLGRQEVEAGEVVWPARALLIYMQGPCLGVQTENVLESVRSLAGS